MYLTTERGVFIDFAHRGSDYWVWLLGESKDLLGQLEGPGEASVDRASYRPGWR